MVYYYTQYLHQLLMAATKRKVFDPAKRTATTQCVYAAQQVKLSMYSALRFTYAALIERGKLRRCITAFSSEELRFWQRFSAFQSVELPPYLVSKTTRRPSTPTSSTSAPTTSPSPRARPTSTPRSPQSFTMRFENSPPSSANPASSNPPSPHARHRPPSRAPRKNRRQERRHPSTPPHHRHGVRRRHTHARRLRSHHRPQTHAETLK